MSFVDDDEVRMNYYFFLRDGKVVEARKFPGGKAALDYCKERYGDSAVVALTVGGQDMTVELRHVLQAGLQ